MKTNRSLELAVLIVTLSFAYLSATSGQERTPALKAGTLNALESRPTSLGEAKSLVPPKVEYDEAKSVKLVPKEDGTIDAQPFVPIPILFKVGTAELLDSIAAENVRLVGEKLASIRKSDPGASFSIEGHASAEGADAENLSLSMRRAKAIMRMLASNGSIPAGALSSAGFGEEFAEHPEDAPDRLLREDRKVLVVRLK